MGSPFSDSINAAISHAGIHSLDQVCAETTPPPFELATVSCFNYCTLQRLSVCFYQLLAASVDDLVSAEVLPAVSQVQPLPLLLESL
jgi:hypothetical protein